MDVPFSLFSQPMRARGRGEQLKPFRCRSYPLVIVKPKLGISTREAYDSLVESHRRNDDMKIQNFISRDIRQVSDGLFNQFQPMMEHQFPEIVGIKQDLLRLGAPNVCLSGTGSALFSVFVESDHASHIYSAMVNQHHEVYLTHIVGDSD